MHTAAYNLIDFDKPVFRSFALWTAILVLKMMYLSLHTAFYRFKNQVSSLFLRPCHRNALNMSKFSIFRPLQISKMLVMRVRFVLTTIKWNVFAGKYIQWNWFQITRHFFFLSSNQNFRFFCLHIQYWNDDPISGPIGTTWKIFYHRLSLAFCMF